MPKITLKGDSTDHLLFVGLFFSFSPHSIVIYFYGLVINYGEGEAKI